MITNPSRVEELLADFQRTENLSYEKKLALLDGMVPLARHLGRFRTEDAPEGIEDLVRLVADLQSLPTTAVTKCRKRSRR